MAKYSRDLIKSLHEQGKSYNEIAAQLNCSKAVVSYHLSAETREKARASSRRSRQKRYDMINELKESKPCADCGGKFEGFLMDFDHLPGFLKVHNVSDIIRSYGWVRVAEELAKCELVCCMCHRKRSKERWLADPLKHSLF